jgi:tetratricopeptide (TPR) repeat protein
MRSFELGNKVFSGGSLSLAWLTLVLLGQTLLLAGCGITQQAGSTGQSSDPAQIITMEDKEADPSAEVDNTVNESVSGVETTTDLTAVEKQRAYLLSLPNPYLQNRVEMDAATRAIFAKGLKAQRAGHLDQAQVEFESLIEKRPELSGPFLNLALIAQKRKQPELAEQRFKQAIEVNPNNLEAYNSLALLYRDQGRFKESEVLWLDALTRWPAYARGNRNLAILYDLHLGQLTLALQYYQSYQLLLDKPDRQVKGWMIDLQRRLPPPAAAAKDLP